MFHEYVSRNATANTPEGDFCADYLRRPMTTEPTRWPELRRFLHSRGADDQVLAAARNVWQAYRVTIAPSASPR